MRRTCVILKCLCALAFATGTGLTASANLVPGTHCYTTSANLPCTSLGGKQCAVPNNGNTCIYCNGGGAAFIKTCVLSYARGDLCPSNGVWKDCGIGFSGTCTQNLDGTYTCSQGPQSTTCKPVYQCNLP
jgi:hypothetical protein